MSLPRAALSACSLRSVFGRKRSDGDSGGSVATDDFDSSAAANPQKKGRPTPKRKEAEAARKAALKSGVSSAGSKKEARKQQREYMREQRIKQREAMMRGDERFLPARDQGAAKKMVRDFVDSRRTVAEFFIPAAVVILVMGMLPNVEIKTVVTFAWLLMIVLVVVDTGFLLFKMNKELAKKFPAKADRKGVNFYAVMRVLQIRRLRLPPPRFKAGGRPIDRG